MPHQLNYKCTGCDAITSRDLLTVKKISFVEMGMGGRTLKSRVIGWLCPHCTARDEVWNLQPFKTPGNVSAHHGSRQAV